MSLSQLWWNTGQQKSLPSLSKSQLWQRNKNTGRRGEFGYGLAAWRPERLTYYWCDSPGVPWISTLKSNKGEKSQRIRWSDSVLPDISFLYFLLPFSSRLKIKLPAVRVKAERQASLWRAVPTASSHVRVPFIRMVTELGRMPGRI